jgi:hypothetical protein
MEILATTDHGVHAIRKIDQSGASSVETRAILHMHANMVPNAG